MKAAARVNFEQSLGLGMRKVYLNPSHSWCQLKPLAQAANFLGPPTSIHLLSSAHLPPPPTPWSGIGRGDKCGGEQWARLSEEQKLPLCEVTGGNIWLAPSHAKRSCVALDISVWKSFGSSSFLWNDEICNSLLILSTLRRLLHLLT